MCVTPYTHSTIPLGQKKDGHLYLVLLTMYSMYCFYASVCARMMMMMMMMLLVVVVVVVVGLGVDLLLP